ncbi:hypothetical protein F5B21DRAFT_495322 [Xylaria acuta]|nr:hypothetical protein F5B21DRAFT_495322 [Xylaria acuta]
MGSRNKARKATTPHGQQHVATAATNSTLYTSSYMIVQELSPPLSSPQPSEQTHKLSDATILPGSCPPISSRRYGQTARSAMLERAVGQSDETAAQDNHGPSREKPACSLIESRVRPRTSQADSSSQKARIQQTTKLVNVLARNKVLLYGCMAEDKDAEGDNCKTIMRRITAAVEDQRFQRWRQVKAWTARQHRKQQRSITVAASSARTTMPKTKRNKGGALLGTAFKKNLVPVLSTAEMTINRRKFLDSVIEAIGTRRLTEAFRHRLARDGELPGDISPLIFSPLFLKTCETHVRKVTLARNRSNSDSDEESEWSDWEEEEDDDDYDGASDESRAMRAASSNALPSIEQENSSEDVPEPATGEGPDGPSTPIKSQEPEIRAPRVKMNRKARRKIERDARNARRNNGERVSRARLQLPPPPTFEDLARQPVPGQVRVPSPVAESACIRERESESLFPPAPSIRPFADFTTPAVSVPSDPETESILRLGSLLRNACEYNNSASLDKVVTSRATNDTQPQSTNPQGKGKLKRKIAAEDQRKDASVSNSHGAATSTSQAKDGPTPIPISIPIANVGLPVRETPAILRAENQRQDRKFAKPLAPTKIPSRPAQRKQNTPSATRRSQGEILPLGFYNPSTRTTRGGNTGAQASTPAQPKSPGYAHDTEAIQSCSADKTRPVGNNSAVQIIPPPQHYPTSSLRQSSPSDDELSLPSLEEIYGHLLPATQGRSTEVPQPRRTIAQTYIIPEPEPGPFSQRETSSKKRPMREPAEEHTAPFPAPAIPPKRVKLLVDADSRICPATADSAQWFGRGDDQARENNILSEGTSRAPSSGTQDTKRQGVQAASTSLQPFKKTPKNRHGASHPNDDINNHIPQGTSRPNPSRTPHLDTRQSFSRGQTLPPTKTKNTLTLTPKSKPVNGVSKAQMTNDPIPTRPRDASTPRHGTPGRGKRSRSRRPGKPAWAISSGKG